MKPPKSQNPLSSSQASSPSTKKTAPTTANTMTKPVPTPRQAPNSPSRPQRGIRHRSRQFNWSHLRHSIHVVIEGTDTPMGKLFDLVLLVAVLASVLVVMLDSVLLFHMQYETLFYYTEWFFTLLFTIEYGLRVYSAPNRLRYMLSFYGIVDFLSILPTYLSLVVMGVQSLLVVRILRMLRIFRILSMTDYMQQAGFLAMALRSSRQKIIVFFVSVIILVTIFGAVIYIVEGAEHGFTSIPVSIYWAIVTMTTVGYGDISPKTPLGQTIASLVMIMGYSIIAVPTGLFTAELNKAMRPQLQPVTCPNCGKFGHAVGANFCDRCGYDLHV